MYARSRLFVCSLVRSCGVIGGSGGIDGLEGVNVLKTAILPHEMYEPMTCKAGFRGGTGSLFDLNKVRCGRLDVFRF